MAHALDDALAVEAADSTAHPSDRDSTAIDGPPPVDPRLWRGMRTGLFLALPLWALIAWLMWALIYSV